MTDQMEKARLFRSLHERDRPFLLPNPWDAGTTRLLSGLAFEAVATTSFGMANVLGRRRATPADILANCRTIADATTLPVSADLENGFADARAEAAKSIRMACEHGAVGGSIEDGTYDLRAPVYEFNLAVERVHAAAEVLGSRREDERDR